MTNSRGESPLLLATLANTSSLLFHFHCDFQYIQILQMAFSEQIVMCRMMCATNTHPPN